MTISKNIVEIECALLELRHDGILHIHIKNEDTFEIDDSRALVEARVELVGERKTPIVYTATKFVIPSKEVREFVATESRSTNVLADAFVINSLPQRLMATMFVTINKPVRPTRIFYHFDDALDWARPYVKQDYL